MDAPARLFSRGSRLSPRVVFTVKWYPLTNQLYRNTKCLPTWESSCWVEHNNSRNVHDLFNFLKSSVLAKLRQDSEPLVNIFRPELVSAPLKFKYAKLKQDSEPPTEDVIKKTRRFGCSSNLHSAHSKYSKRRLDRKWHGLPCNDHLGQSF